MSDQTPTMGHVIRAALDFFSAGFYVARPGRIERVDTTKGVVDVKPLIKETFQDSGGDDQTEALEIVCNVPIHFPGGGEFVDTFPIAKGDPCWLLFSDRNLTLWHENGTDVDPVLADRHSPGAGALCILGGRPKAKAISEFDTARRVVGKQGGPRAAFAGDVIHLGVDHNENATEKAVLGSTYRQKEDTWFQDLATQLSQAGTALTLAQTTMQTAATANAVPYTGGGAAATPFNACAAALGQAASALSQISSKLSSFTGGGPYLSEKVKVK